MLRFFLHLGHALRRSATFAAHWLLRTCNIASAEMIFQGERRQCKK